MTRPVDEIAMAIYRCWPKVHYAAAPYLNAMARHDYGCDGEQSVIRYFLSNATSFRGEDARRLKAELKEHLK